MRHFFYVLYFIFFSFSGLFGQTNPSNDNLPLESNDTVIILKTPVVVRKVLYIEEEVKLSTFFVEVFASPFQNFNYYNVCENCKPYLVKLKETTKPTLGYSAGANLMYMNKHLYSSVGVAHTNVREIFNYPGLSKSINNFNYLDINLSGGYRMKSKRLSVIITGGGIMSQLLSLKGNTISEADTNSMVDIRSQNQFRKTSYSFTLSLKLIYELSYKFSILAEPFYRGDITSITQRKELYAEQRNFLGTKLGVVYAF
jgi:hypothetical protein